ncbi:MAG TPA: hypothetical protein VMX35_09955 [Acidobacteriota bacterium]|nr:hypothetical protein [Acidobacteriota bacterium]
MSKHVSSLTLLLAVLALLFGWMESGGSAQVEVKNCSICHGKQSYKRYVLPSGDVADLFVDEAVLAGSVHHERECIGCHADVTTVPHEGYKPKPVDCTRCHYLGNPVKAPQSETYQAYLESAHGQALAKGIEKAPRCQDCHGTHDVQKNESPDSLVSQFMVSDTCAACHRKAWDDFRQSIHGISLYDKRSADAPACTSCHGEHGIFAKDDPRSRTNLSHVIDDCAECHEAMEIVGKYGVSISQIETYRKSFHGIASRFGSTVAANCASCHGHHLVLPQNDPRSTVSIENIPKTCGQLACHEGAGTNFAIGKVHVNPEEEESGMVYYVSTFFRYFTALVILGLVVHIALDLGRRFLGIKKQKSGKEGESAGKEGS